MMPRALETQRKQPRSIMFPLLSEYDYESDLTTYYERRIMSLERQRIKITCRGKLTAAEDRRLDEIDSELLYWMDCLDALTYYSDGEDVE